MERQRKGRQSGESAEQTRNTIMSTALHLFASRGFEETGMREIALAAGTTHSLIRHHFGSKEGIWQAVVSQAFNEFAVALRTCVDATNAPQDAEMMLQRMLRAFLHVCARTPEVVHLLLDEGTRQNGRLAFVMQQAVPLDEMIQPLLQQVQQQGALLQFDSRSLALYIIMAGAAPFGFPAFSNEILKVDILSEEQSRQHIDRILRTLFLT